MKQSVETEQYHIMRFNILENALDELLFACSCLEGFLDCLCEEIRGAKNNILPGIIYAKLAKDGLLKVSLCHLFSGCELLFKSALFYKDKKLILMKPDEDAITDKRFAVGDFKSIKFDEATIRIKDSLGYDYTRGSQKSIHLFQLKAVRNKIEHFAVMLPISDVLNLWFSSWQELSEFCNLVILPYLSKENLEDMYASVCKYFLHAFDFYKQLIDESNTQNIFDFKIEI